MAEGTEHQSVSKGSTDLQGQVAIITGATSGLGQAIAEQLVLRGTHVALDGRRAERLNAFAERVKGEGHGETLVVPGDVRDPEHVQQLVRQTLDRWGKLDILVGNAGFGYRSPVIDGDIQRWKDMIDTNVYGLLLTLKYGVRPMLERKSGHVIVMSSTAGIQAQPGGSAYCASKFAARAISESLRQEVASQGVRVTAIEPGVVISEFQQVAGYTPDVLPRMLQGAEPLMPIDVARTVLAVLEMPAYVGIGEVVVRPTGQAYP